MDRIADRVCEVCGKPAVQGTRDLREAVDGVADDVGRIWVVWEYDGPSRWRCGDHLREPRVTYQEAGECHTCEDIEGHVPMSHKLH